MKKDTKTYLILVVIVVLIISVIVFLKAKNEGGADPNTIKCISSKSILIASYSCVHCAEQKRILGDYAKEFNLVYVEDTPEIWTQYNLEGVPAWIIDNKIHYGSKSIKELKELTKC